MARKAKNVVRYNDQAITKLARSSVEKQTEWKIEGVAGLSLVVKPNGAATYYVRCTAGEGSRRKQQRIALGKHGIITLGHARARALSIASDLAMGGDPIGEANERKRAVTLKELFEERLAKDRERASRTLDDYQLALEKYVFPTLGDRPANEITATDLVEVLERAEAGSRHAAHKVRSALGSTYRWAYKRRRVDQNPTVGLGFTYQSKPRSVVLKDDDISNLWTAIDSEEFGSIEPMRILLKLALLTGQRRGEIAGARIEELELHREKPVWRIPAERMKRKGREQVVPLSSQAVELFEQAIALAEGDDSGYVFPGTTHGRRFGQEWRQRHIAPTSVSKAFGRARELAGLRELSPVMHDFRTSITTWLREEMHTREDVCDLILHHARGGVTASHYDFSVLDGPVRTAFQQWADHVWQITGQASAREEKVVQLRR